MIEGRGDENKRDEEDRKMPSIPDNDASDEGNAQMALDASAPAQIPEKGNMELDPVLQDDSSHQSGTAASKQKETTRPTASQPARNRPPQSSSTKL